MTITLFSSPIDPKLNPYAHPSFFDLNFNPAIPDDVQLTPGLLTVYAGGLRALEGDDTVYGSTDSEVFNGNAGKDLLAGNEGSDIILGGRDNDEVYGDQGNDSLNGNLGKDIVDGGIGNDWIRGGKEEDLLIGGQGNDTLIGDFGRDALLGGSDSDLFVLRTDTVINQPAEEDILIDFNQSIDKIGLTGGLSEVNLTFSTFKTSLQEEIQNGLKNSGFSQQEAQVLAPELLNYFKSLSNQNSPLPLGIQSLLIQQNFGSSQEIQAILQGKIRYQDLDPNGDGLIEGTKIKFNEQVLGSVLNVMPANLNGQFISLPDIV